MTIEFFEEQAMTYLLKEKNMMITFWQFLAACAIIDGLTFIAAKFFRRKYNVSTSTRDKNNRRRLTRVGTN
tara:strand:- start:32 stop:244 length:213 start_codon:yes stop_codon:yes gene_type:complete